MRIGEIKPATSSLLGLCGGEPTPKAIESRALVALASPVQTSTMPARGSITPAGYRQAPFLAHLLAVKNQHAQTRERRRTGVHEAIAAYEAAAALVS